MPAGPLANRSSFLEHREAQTAINWLFDMVYYLAAFGNARSEHRWITNPRFVEAVLPPGAPRPPQRDDDIDSTGERRKIRIDEGTAFFMDPYTVWGSYMPTLAGLVLLAIAIPLPPIAAIPFAIGGGVSLIVGIGWFILFTEMGQPLTLFIRQDVTTMYLRDCRVTTFNWWIRKLIGMVIVRIPCARAITIESDKSDPANLLQSHMLLPKDENEDPRKVMESEEKIRESSQVEVSFDGVFAYGLDIRWMHTLKMMFFDDFLAHPDDSMVERCQRLIQPVIYAACDPILQLIPWKLAVSAIAFINEKLLQGLPDELEHLAIHVESVLLSKAYGLPFTELERRTTAKLKSQADQDVAEQTRAAEVVKADAGAKIAEAQAEARKRKEVADAEADKQGRVARQRTEEAEQIAMLQVVNAKKPVKQAEAEIAILALSARLDLIKDKEWLVVINALTELSEADRAKILGQSVESVAKMQASGTVVNVAGDQSMFPLAAIMQQAARFLNLPIPSGPVPAAPPAAPPPASPPAGP